MQSSQKNTYKQNIKMQRKIKIPAQFNRKF